MTFILYDKSNKKINLEKLSLDDKKKIINGDLKIKNLDSKLRNHLSTDDNFIPMFDIINESIYFIEKTEIFKLIIHNNFRVLNEDLINFLKKNNFNKELIEIINLFDFDILESLFLKFIYYNSKEVGADISYYKNPAFVKFLDINPYLKKSAIINTALNTGILNIKNLPIKNDKLEEIYLKIKKYLFTDDIIITHMNLIKKNSANSLISFFSLYGAYFINTYLRNTENKYYDETIINQIYKINNIISKTPYLDEPKLIFRFIKDDTYLNLHKVGDIYINESFMSCTRKPNINATNNEFGFILLKINLTKKFKGYFLCIESNSVFPKEKEIIIKPGVKFRLKSIDDNVDFILFENNHSRNIKKKYELEIIGIEDIKVEEYKKIKLPEFELKNIKLDGISLEDKIDYFWDNYCRQYKSFYIILPNNQRKLFYCNKYDSTELYSKFYYYKVIDGFFLFSFNEENNLDIFIEIGDELIVNYPNKYLNFSEYKGLKLVSSLFCNLFEITTIIMKCRF